MHPLTQPFHLSHTPIFSRKGATLPHLIIDFATLTGAARVALGSELPAIFSNNKEELHRLWDISSFINDPMYVQNLANQSLIITNPIITTNSHHGR